MPEDHAVTRRTVVAGGGAAVGALMLAACGGGSGGSSVLRSDKGGSTDAPTAGGQTTSAAPADTKPLATLAEIPVGQAVSVKEADGSTVIVARPTATTAAAFSAICTHMGCTVAPAGKELHCPCHGSKYDATTGQVIHGPAPRALSPVPVHVTGGKVLPGAS